LHIAAESDRAAAIALARQLCEGARYRVPGIELVDSPRYPQRLDIRYYYEPQQSEAATIATMLRQAAPGSGAPPSWNNAARLQQLTGYPNLPRDRIEVWLPRGPEVEAPAPADPRFRC
jgi:hypothetical protein